MKRNSAQGKGARGVKAEEPEPEPTLAEVRERVWRALPSVRQASDTAALVATQGAVVVSPTSVPTGGGAAEFASAAPTTQVPWEEVRRVMENVYLATHANPIAKDVDNAVDGVLGPREAPTQAVFTQDELYNLLDSVPQRWLPHLLLPDAEAQRATLIRRLNEELIDCITHDEPPHDLLPAEQVLMLPQTAVTRPASVVSYVEDFLRFQVHRSYAEVYDALWHHLVADGTEGMTTTLTLAQFRVFFVWFHVLHFSHTTPTRSEAAAESLWRRCLDQRGTMTMGSFQQACREMCAHYARRRDAAAYLDELVKATDEVLRQKSGVSCTGLLFFDATDDVVAHVEATVLGPAGLTRRAVQDPVMELYLPEEMQRPRALNDAAYEAMRLVSRTRLVLHGRPCVGKRRVGRALAARLHAVYLDVEELALAALRRGDATGLQLAELLRAERPVPLDLQAALLRCELTSNRVLYHGYVLSDTLVHCGCATQCAAMADYLAQAGLLTECVPTAFVELGVADEGVYQEHRSRVQAARAEARAAACRAMNDLNARRAREAERRERRTSAEAALQHLVAMEAAVNALPAPPTTRPAGVSKAAAAAAAAALEEQRQAATSALALAQTAAAAAQEVLRGLEAEEVDAAWAGEEGADGAEGVTATLVTAERAIEQQYEECQLRHLLREGRVVACARHEDCIVTTEPLTTTAQAYVGQPIAKLLPCLRGLLDSAAAEQRVLTVEATSSQRSIVDYVVGALELQPCAVARRISVQDGTDSHHDGDADDFDHAEDDRDAAAAEAAAGEEDEEDGGRQKEERALAEGYVASHVWKHYCPVTMLEDGVLVEGAACYGCTYRGHIYYCASRAKLRRFRDRPSYFLAHDPCDHRRILLLAENATPTPGNAADILPRVTAEMAPRLELTPIAFSTYSEAMETRHRLQEARKAVLATRQAYEVTERAARQERLEKRLKQDAKRRRAASQGRKGKAGRVSIKVPPKDGEEGDDNTNGDAGKKRTAAEAIATAAAKDRAAKAKLVRRVEDGIAEHIATMRQRRRDLVPVLVYGDAVDAAKMSFLAQEGLLPETIVVLQDKDALHEVDGTADDATTMTTVAEVLTSLEEQQMVSVLRVATEGRALRHVLSEIMQHISPAAPPVLDAAVDEALGEQDEDEDDASSDEEDEQTGGAGDEGGRGGGRALAPELRPGRRFLHQFGSRLNYCPVTLVEKGLLVRGNHGWCARYLDELYVFASDDCRRRFQRNPREYVGAPVSRDVPPRLWVVGPRLAGKRTLAEGLQRAFGVPSFVYKREFFECCVKAAQTPGGAWVRADLFVPEDATNANVYLRRAHTLLEELRLFAEEQATALAQRSAAERLVAERERADAERAERDLDEEEDEENEMGGAVDEAAEERLRAQLEFEPEAEEDRQVRLSEAYLRIASCVTRIEPFASKGYIMVCPPFSEGDLEVLFNEGGTPEAVIHLGLDADALRTREAAVAAAHRDVQGSGVTQLAQAGEAASVAAQRRAAQWRRQRERRLRRWRRRHIGAADPPSDDEDDARAADVDEAQRGSGAGVTAAAEEIDRAAEAEALELFIECVTENLIDVVRIQGDSGPNTVLHAAIERLARHLPQRGSLFFVPRVISYDAARQLLRQGVAEWSCFGDGDVVALHTAREGGRRRCRWKPAGRCETQEGDAPSNTAANAATVDGIDEDGVRSTTSNAPHDLETGLKDDISSHTNAEDEGDGDEAQDELSEYDADEVQEMLARRQRWQRRHDARLAPRAAVLADRVYFFHDDDNLRSFVRDPMRYVEQAPPPAALRVQPVVTVMEDDVLRRAAAECFSGVKSRSLADAVAHSLGYHLLSVSKLLAWAALQPQLGTLATQSIAAAMQCEASESLLLRLLRLRLASADVKARGAVLLNLPRTVSQYEALLRDSASDQTGRAACAPIVRVCAIQCVPHEVVGSTCYRRASDALRDVLARMRVEAAMVFDLPCPDNAHTVANLNEFVWCVDRLVGHERQALRRCSEAFAVDLRDGYHTHAAVGRQLSEYGWYCPYAWKEKGDLELLHPSYREVRLTDETTGDEDGAAVTSDGPRWAALYLGKYYLFSSRSYLDRFLHDPCEVADPTTLKPLPPALPTHIAATPEMDLEKFAFAGCCPVMLYDTRERRGLRGGLEPVAKRGSLQCVVRYADELYAVLDRPHLTRFMRQPWTYLGGASMPPPRKCPLSRAEAAAGLSHETFMRRQLYDAVAHAMLAVAAVRPHYPGLSVEESALKFMALHMKANKEENDEVQRVQYKENLDLFTRRATLYRQMDDLLPSETNSSTAAVDEARAASHDALCAAYETMVYGEDNVADFIHLRDVSATAQPRSAE